MKYHQSSEPDRDKKQPRVVHAAQGDGVMEFGLRRAQGPDAGLYGARAAMIGGCVGTSNVLAGKMFDVPIMGTPCPQLDHEFSGRVHRIQAYAELYPDACTLWWTPMTVKSRSSKCDPRLPVK